MLLLITGLPGSGKTTIARAYAERCRALHLNSDHVRAQLGLLGHYSAEAKQQVYDALLARTREALLAGRNVVLDSVLHREAVREPFRRVAAECGTPCYWVLLHISEETARQRLAQPRPDSEANFEVFEKLRAEWEPIQGHHLVLQADAMSQEDLLDAICQYVR